MQRISISAQFQGRASRPSGDPPRTDPAATSVSVHAVMSDGSPFEIEAASYSNHVAYTGESTFSETGTISFGSGGDEIEIATVGEGTLGPSADSELMHGAVIYRVTEGRRRFLGATGLITSNFLLRPATGEFEERQLAVIFLP